jgi:hypothetical protein
MKKSVVRRTVGLLIASLLAFATSSYFATAAVFADPTGIWLVKDGTTRIRIEKCGPNNSNICGYAVWLMEPHMLMVLCGSQTWKRVTDVMPGQLAGPVNGPNGPRSD